VIYDYVMSLFTIISMPNKLLYDFVFIKLDLSISQLGCLPHFEVWLEL